MYVATVVKMRSPAQKVHLIAILFAAELIWSTTHAGPIVNTKLGKIQGNILTSDEGADFFAFRGIPYAKPPIKGLRFSPPQSFDQKYEGTLQAIDDGNVCIQYNHIAKAFTGDEDCLYLNVYTPKFDSQDLLPVMFWIHGGGFFMGSGAFHEFGPHKLMDKNVILVTINYRLGPFGFLSTLDEASPGNYGLLDQVMALKWVQDNIASFGGDPNRVTIFGASAGSMSVGFHLLSPLSKGLFHAAIAHSGSALVENMVSQEESTSLHFTKDVADRIGCPSHCNKKMVECLRKKPALDFIIKSALTIDNYTTASADIATFKVVVDTARGDKAFLPDFPQKLLAQNKFNAVPFLTGANKDEGILTMPAIQGLGGLILFGKEHFPIILKYNAPSLFKNEDQGMIASQIVADKYFEDFDGSNLKQKLVGLSKFLGDVYLTYMMDVLNDYLVEYNVPTYVYKFNYKGERSYTELLPPSPLLSEDLKIVTHGDELIYIFRNDFFKSENPPREEDRRMSDIILTLWSNFAKTHVPTMQGSSYDHPTLKWEPLSSGNRPCLELNTDPHMISCRLSYGYDTLKDAYNIASNYKDEL